jgi:hypothetical protein
MIDTAPSPPRLALLIAQEIYRTGSGFAKLNTPVAGALALAEELEDCGFEVTLVGDEPNRVEPYGMAELTEAVVRFVARADAIEDAIVFFYFAGHGVAHGDDYFMLSETARLQDFRAGGLDLSYLTDRLDRKDEGFAIIVSDACRDHPFPAESDRLRRGLPVAGMESMLQRREMRLDRGLVAISAGDGDIVFDDPGGLGKSLFTSELIKALRVKGASASTVFLGVMEAVSKATNRRQRPSIAMFEGSLEVILNEGPGPARVSGTTRSKPRANTKPWADHKGPLVTVVPIGQDPGIKGKRRTILLSLARGSGWSLNPIAVLTGDQRRRQDISATFAEILSAGMPGHLPLTEEHEARLMLSTILQMIASFRLESLRDITKLDDIWDYLARLDKRQEIGTVVDDPVFAMAMMADRLAAISQKDSFEYKQLAEFLDRARDSDRQKSIALRDRIAMAALRPLRDFQRDPFVRAMSPGNVDLNDVLRDPGLHIIIEHNTQSAPSMQAATGLWLAAIRIAADVIPDRPPLMIALPYGPAPSTLPLQISRADVILP